MISYGETMKENKDKQILVRVSSDLHQKEMNMPINTMEELNNINFPNRPEMPFWNDPEEKEMSMHKIHIYPAKFPSLIAQKAFKYAINENIKINTVADIFCGCGTVAVEAKRKGLNFWGCDLNPVAVLISEVKTANYSDETVKKLGDAIILKFKKSPFISDYENANKRLKYWFHKNQFDDLARLKNAIEEETGNDEYRKLFFCLFSSILKKTSKWLTSSIKPQVDPDKEPADVLLSFIKQIDAMVKAVHEVAYKNVLKPTILCDSVLRVDDQEIADMIITSPPYVTSYEYADLHQLSALWLGYADDYTNLRQDSIGSSYGTGKQEYLALQPTAQKVVNYFTPMRSQSRSIARYYVNMHQFVSKSYALLRQGGIAVFVIGDTEYKGNLIENAKALCESMIKCGYTINVITKRKIQNKFLPSHRGENGKFSSNKQDRAIYSQEYIIIGRKN
jgi:DNA modification methylase